VREFDVARGVAAGQTNTEIADRLFLSETTVRNHVSRILLKLAMHNRSQLAAWMAEREAMRRVTDPLQTEGAS
jgi:DNA-binding NarL/FixJ family response regulator